MFSTNNYTAQRSTDRHNLCFRLTVDDTTYSGFADSLAKSGGKVTGAAEAKAKAEAAKKAEAEKNGANKATAASNGAGASSADMEKLKKEHAEAVAAKDAKIKELEEKVKELAKSTQDYKEKHLACLADKDNLVKITKRDVENAKDFGIKQLVMKQFDVIDTINICIDNMKDPNALEAMESVKKQFMKVLTDYGVEELAPQVGDKFDANFHNALFEIEPTAPGQQARTIGLIVKNGWARKGALLRAAAVGVYSKDFVPSDSTQQPTPESSNL